MGLVIVLLYLIFLLIGPPDSASLHVKILALIARLARKPGFRDRLLEAEKAVDTLDRYGIPVGAVFLNRVLPNEATGEFLERRREPESQYLDRAAGTFSRHTVHRIPLQETDVHGLAALRRIVAFLPESERAALS